MAADLTIDGDLLTYQPTEIEVIPAAAVETQTVSGTYSATPRPFGAEIRITWGVDVATLEAMNELRTARGGLISHEIEFTDPSGTTHTYVVNWISDPPFIISVEQFYKRFTIVFRERPEDEA